MADKIQYEMSSDHLEAGQSSGEKPTVLDFDDDMVHNEERAPEARGFHENQLSKVYWTSPTFLGSYFAAALTFTASVGGYAQTAPLLSYIDEDIGPSELIHVRNLTLDSMPSSYGPASTDCSDCHLNSTCPWPTWLLRQWPCKSSAA